MRNAAGETITGTRLGAPGAADSLGNPVPAASATFTVTDVALAPSSGLEDPTTTGLLAITGYTVYAPYGTVIQKTDVFTIRGVEGWQVEGESAAAGWRNPFDGRGRGIVFSVKRAG